MSQSKIRAKVKAIRKAKRTAYHKARQMAKKSYWAELKARWLESDLGQNEARQKAIIASMSNWQRTQWAKAGYPKAIEKLKHFATLEKAS